VGEDLENAISNWELIALAFLWLSMCLIFDYGREGYSPPTLSGRLGLGLGLVLGPGRWKVSVYD